jgi:hypothetical protein
MTSKVVELFGLSAAKSDVDWRSVVKQQQCAYTDKKCYKIRKSDPGTAMGSCTVRYGSASEPVVIYGATEGAGLLSQFECFTGAGQGFTGEYILTYQQKLA